MLPTSSKVASLAFRLGMQQASVELESEMRGIDRCIDLLRDIRAQPAENPEQFEKLLGQLDFAMKGEYERRAERISINHDAFD